MRSSLDSWTERAAAMRSEHFSARTLDAGGTLDAPRLEAVREALETFGAVHVQHTGLAGLADVTQVLEPLGFGEGARFSLGGRTSAAWQEKWVAPGLRRMDHYPPSLYLLPNNEVQYRRCSPRWVLFACLAAPGDGGRVFLHRAQAVEAELASSEPGRTLLERLAREGLCIETGFLDRRHPLKAENYFQSWQERFETDDADEALARARAQGDEYDACWWGPEQTLMTRITLSAWWHGHLRFPRIALDGPAPRNGYRRFPLGHGEELGAADQELLRAAYLATRQGVALQEGDLVLFDNLRFGHSRESFSGPRELAVGMAGAVWDPKCGVPLTPPPVPPVKPFAHETKPPRFTVPPDFEARFSARTFDAKGTLDADVVRREFERHGALHVRHTGLPGELPEDVLRDLGFGADEAFPWGGLSSGRTTRAALSRDLRATDAYPAHLWLLPHNEVLYQRTMPARLLFFSASGGDVARGGRTFVHAAEHLEAWLRAQGGRGDALLESLRRHGLRIEMGFLDERHPEKANNYFRSWQDRFATDDRDEAEARCRASTLQFDTCWWREEDGGCATLMTRICVPAFHQGRLLFPRIALDAPALRNGYRCYPRGDGSEFTDGELDLLLNGFLATREGVHYGPGDLLLVDNVRYGHSREAFEGPRTLGVAMAGAVHL